MKKISLLTIILIMIITLTACSISSTFGTQSVEGYWLKQDSFTTDGLYIHDDTVKLYALGDPDGTFYESACTSFQMTKENDKYYLVQGGKVGGVITKQGDTIVLSNCGAFNGTYSSTSEFKLK